MHHAMSNVAVLNSKTKIFQASNSPRYRNWAAYSISDSINIVILELIPNEFIKLCPTKT